MSRSRALGGAAAKGGLVLALALSVGGYTVAESAEQRATVQALEAEQAAEQAAVRAAAEQHREAVAAERQRAVATAQDAVADADAVRTVAAGAVTEADLAPLLAAVDALNVLLQRAPTAPIAEVDGVASGAPAVPRDERASRDAVRGAAPTAGAPTADAATAVPAAGAEQPAGDAMAPGATPEGGTTSDPAQSPETTTGEGGIDGATEPPAPADDAAPEDDVSAEILAAVAAVTAETARVQATADANLAAQQAAADAAAQAAAAAAAEAAAKEAQRVSLDAYANGRVPADALCDLAVGAGHQLRCDAAEALVALDAAYTAEFGTPLTISDSYRSYAAQVACRRVKGSLCAVPGTSNHGRGVAVDLAGGVQTFGTRQHRWMEANADDYGWDLPDWASRGGSKPEPWHWEYVG